MGCRGSRYPLSFGRQTPARQPFLPAAWIDTITPRQGGGAIVTGFNARLKIGARCLRTGLRDFPTRGIVVITDNDVAEQDSPRTFRTD
jgi:hypothetical protein